MNEQRDYSLLRPFDLEAAIAGEPLLWGGQYIPVTFVARGNRGKTNIIERPGGHGGLLSEVCYAPDDYLRMAPLCWVEGKPIYKGDVLYYINQPGRKFTANGITQDGTLINERGHGENIACLTWGPPKRKVKKQGFINIYPASAHHGINALASSDQVIYFDKDHANINAREGRLFCATVEWDQEVSE